MIFTASQLIAHGFGDYVLQSHWMATEKTKSSRAAFSHVVYYSFPFFFLRPSPLALLVILSTHFVIDRWRLARFVVWFKNLLLDFNLNPVDWDDPKTFPTLYSMQTGFPSDTPQFLSFWLLIIVDNLLHITLNGLALHYL
jgi:hypothetical protein